MYQALLQDSSLFDLLLRFDVDLAEEARRQGCPCGAPVHAASYPRKPRGGPPGLSPEHTIRFSFCCAKEGCRRRLTPASVRFLGRRVFFGAVVLLVPILRQGPTPTRLRQLCARFAVSVRTLRRWMRWWRETFPVSRFWRTARGYLARPVARDALPSSLLEVFSEARGLREQILVALSFLTPISSGADRAF